MNPEKQNINEILFKSKKLKQSDVKEIVNHASKIINDLKPKELSLLRQRILERVDEQDLEIIVELSFKALLLLKNNGEAKLIGEVVLPKGFLPTLQEYNKWIDEHLANKERIREIEADRKREIDKRENGLPEYKPSPVPSTSYLGKDEYTPPPTEE